MSYNFINYKVGSSVKPRYVFPSQWYPVLSQEHSGSCEWVLYSTPWMPRWDFHWCGDM